MISKLHAFSKLQVHLFNYSDFPHYFFKVTMCVLPDGNRSMYFRKHVSRVIKISSDYTIIVCTYDPNKTKNYTNQYVIENGTTLLHSKL